MNDVNVWAKSPTVVECKNNLFGALICLHPKS
jgi:hypothetical protein